MWAYGRLGIRDEFLMGELANRVVFNSFFPVVLQNWPIPGVNTQGLPYLILTCFFSAYQYENEHRVYFFTCGLSTQRYVMDFKPNLSLSRTPFVNSVFSLLSNKGGNFFEFNFL